MWACKIARQNAVDQIWPLLGFRLRDSLAVGEVAAGKMSPGPRCSWRRLVGRPRKRLIYKKVRFPYKA